MRKFKARISIDFIKTPLESLYNLAILWDILRHLILPILMIIIAGLWYQTQQWMKSYSCICSNMYLQTYTSFVSDSNAALCV